MRYSIWVRRAAILVAALSFVATTSPVRAGESTMPPEYVETIKPELAQQYKYIEDGDYTQTLNIPTYEWKPVGKPTRAVILGIHGLTLHGRRYRVLARSLAVNGIDFISMDMRGFGRCRFDDEKKFSTADDDKSKVNYEKSYEEIVQLAKLIKEQNPDVRLIALGESLGCTFCVRLAAEHPDLLTGIVLSAPAVKVNDGMYAGKGQIREGLKSIVTGKDLDMRGFFAELVSQNPEVRKEMMDDPHIVKELPVLTLLATNEFVDKTVKWGKQTDPHLSVLILQGSNDGCVSPKHVTDLMAGMPSDDQNLAWRGNFGHLQLETIFMKAAIVDAIASWLIDHSDAQKAKLKGLQQDIADLGGTLLQ